MDEVTRKIQELEEREEAFERERQAFLQEKLKERECFEREKMELAKEKEVFRQEKELSLIHI